MAKNKKKKVSFGGLDVDNPDQIEMDQEAKADKKSKQDLKKASLPTLMTSLWCSVLSHCCF